MSEYDDHDDDDYEVDVDVDETVSLDVVARLVDDLRAKIAELRDENARPRSVYGTVKIALLGDKGEIINLQSLHAEQGRKNQICLRALKRTNGVDDNGKMTWLEELVEVDIVIELASINVS